MNRTGNIFKKVRNAQFLKPHILSASFYKWQKEYIDCRIVHLLVLNRVFVYQNVWNEKFVQYADMSMVAVHWNTT